MWTAPEPSREVAIRLLSRYAQAWADEVAWILLAAVLFGVLWRALEGRPAWSPRAWWLGLAAVLTASLAWALHLGWIADDAFISFRYAKNWVNGLGLQYNPGDRVEGYTNFLWVVLLAPFEWLKVPLPLASLGLTLACLSGVLWLAAVLPRALSDRSQLLPWPLASLMLGLNYSFASFGTSGMETMLGSLLVLWALVEAQREHPGRAATLGILATLTHPDHAIFYVCLCAALLSMPAPGPDARAECATPQQARVAGKLAPLTACASWAWARRRVMAACAAPFLLLYLPYFAWRYAYYGDFFPNTYYAKNADLPYFTQGLRYLALSGMSTGLFAVLPAAAFGAYRHRSSVVARFAWLAVPAFLLYVSKVGGDFMLGRLLCPLLPPVYVLAELGLSALAGTTGRRAIRAAALTLCLTAIVPVRFVAAREIYAHVADERTYYPIDGYWPFSLDNAYFHWASQVSELLRGVEPKPTLAMFSVGIMGYQTGLPFVDNAGLNHRELARWRNRGRGRPGHEKLMRPAILVRTEADLSDEPAFPEPYHPLGLVDLGGLRLHAVRYDPDVFEALQRAGVAPPPLLGHLDAYAPPADRRRLACDLWYLSQIYFSHNQDPARRSRLLSAVVRELPELRGLESLLLAEPASRRLAEASPLRPVWRRSFELRRPGDQSGGRAFEGSPSPRTPPGQSPATGATGAFLNSYTARRGAGAVGWFETEPFSIAGDAITLQVAGGFSPGSIVVELVVDDRVERSATGCDSDILSRRVWSTRELRGQMARLRVVDRERGGLGYVAVDELTQWARRPGSGAPTQTASAQQLEPSELP